MHYGAFKNYLTNKGLAKEFVNLCIKRIDEIEQRYGVEIEELVATDDAMFATLTALEWRVEKDDLDNYQNALKHYYFMAHSHEFHGHVPDNKRLK